MATAPTNSDEDGSDVTTSLVALFHLVNSLLPDDQEVVGIRPDAPVADALDLMERYGFSQLPVMVGEHVIGVFSYRSFARRVAELGRVTVETLEVDDCVEQLRFVRVSDELEALFDWLDRDGAVLVGDPDRLLAVATETDLIRYLYGVTHPFVLIQEIELVLRGLVSRGVDATTLPQFIHRALGKKYAGEADAIPTDLTGLSFGELVLVATNGDNYANAFSKLLGRNRDSARGYLDPIPNLRNEIFHFRRRVTGEDLQTLANTRTWLLRKALAAEAGDPRG